MDTWKDQKSNWHRMTGPVFCVLPPSARLSLAWYMHNHNLLFERSSELHAIKSTSNYDRPQSFAVSDSIPLFSFCKVFWCVVEASIHLRRR